MAWGIRLCSYRFVNAFLSACARDPQIDGFSAMCAGLGLGFNSLPTHGGSSRVASHASDSEQPLPDFEVQLEGPGSARIASGTAPAARVPLCDAFFARQKLSNRLCSLATHTMGPQQCVPSAILVRNCSRPKNGQDTDRWALSNVCVGLGLCAWGFWFVCLGLVQPGGGHRAGLCALCIWGSTAWT
jgi:hypothetical protein